MAITKRPPNRVALEMIPLENQTDHSNAGAAITPGMMIEQFLNSGALDWRPRSSATATFTMAVALERADMNELIPLEDPYAAGELIRVGFLRPGALFLGILLSGETAALGDPLKPDATGKFVASNGTTDDVQTTALAIFQSEDAIGGPVAADTRIRLRVLQ